MFIFDLAYYFERNQEAIEGIQSQGGQGNPALRKEVTSWINNPDNARQVSLFLRALTEFNISPDRQAPWKDAAREWRLPYWDWALKQPYINDLGVPRIFTEDRVDILDFADNSPATMENIENPLARFSNPTGVAMGDFALTEEPWSKAITTSRHGIDPTDTTASWAGGVNNWKKANEAMQAGNGRTSIPDQIYRLCHEPELPPSTATDFMSLAAIHNGIYGYVGDKDTGGLVGQMGDPPVAAFDPIFWFHHCNVDHLAATFQTLHSDMLDWKGNLRYSYDDLEAPRQRRASAMFHSFTARALGRPRTGSHNNLLFLRSRINEKYGTENDYTINVIYDRYALDGAPYHIHFSLGIPPPDADAFWRADNYIGSIYTFSSNLEPSGVLSTAQIPLTSAILQAAKYPNKSGLHTMEPGEVEPYLESNLTWRATAAVQVTLVDNLPKTKIFAMKRRVQYPDGDSELSSYSDHTAIWRATSGNPGGAVMADAQSIT
ncbi:common central domain of tyrosinase-domain-containing protein [Aspergillus spectabilis]